MALFGGKRYNTRKIPQRGIQLTMITGYGTQEEKVFEVPTANIVSFSCTRNAQDRANTFNLTLIGGFSLELEYQLMLGSKKVFIRYGYQGVESKEFAGEIIRATPHFEQRAIAFNIEGVVSMYHGDTIRRNAIWKAGTLFSKIIDLICTAHNWGKGFIVDAEPLIEDVIQANMSDSEFLSTILCHEIKSKDAGISGYSLWFTNQGSKVYLNYAPLSYKRDDIDEYLYDLNGSSNSRLLSFEPSNMGESAFNIGSSIVSAGIDEDTGEILVYTSDNAKKSASSLERRQSGALLGQRKTFLNNNPSFVPVSSSKEAQKAVNAYWNKLYAISIEAKATFIGDLNLDVGRTINIVVVLTDGSVHYTSGAYTITQVKDTIDANGFITEADLVKVTANLGD